MLAKQYVFMVKKMRKKVMTAIALLPIFALPVFAVINRIYSWNATYYFAIALPQNMGEPLEKLEISQTEGFDKVNFYIAIKQLLICNLHQAIELPSLVKLSCCQAKLKIAQNSQLLLIPRYLRAMSLTVSS
jgi:hypothetical protein